MKNLAVLFPVFNDWKSFALLLGHLSDCLSSADYRLHVYVVDDGSLEEPADLESHLAEGPIAAIEILHLPTNLGHQRAIAIGLCEINTRDDIDLTLIMDSDGEDRPVDARALLEEAQRNPGKVIVAHRAKRSEKPAFRVGYFFYKVLFSLLTGHSISFGNFMVIPQEHLSRLVHTPELWSHLASTVSRSRLPLVKLHTLRGKRLDGRSNMNVISLVTHGLSAFSVYGDIVFVRLLIACLIFAALVISGVGVILYLRLFTDMVVPGWASSSIISLLILIFQAAIVMFATVFLLILRRSTILNLPSDVAGKYIVRRTRVESDA